MFILYFLINIFLFSSSIFGITSFLLRTPCQFTTAHIKKVVSNKAREHIYKKTFEAIETFERQHFLETLEKKEQKTKKKLKDTFIKNDPCPHCFLTIAKLLRLFS